MFLYFLPISRAQLKWCWLRDIGLDYAFPNDAYRVSEVLRGPGGKGGIILADSHYGEAKHKYDPPSQEWKQVSPADVSPKEEIYVGRTLGDTYAPEQFERDSGMPSHLVRLADGNQWRIPCAQRWQSEVSLVDTAPRNIAMDDNGNWVTGETIQQYKSFYARAKAWWDAFVGGKQLGDGDVFELVLDAIKINYRLGGREVAMLQLLDQNVIEKILLAVVDWGTFVEFQKKTLP